MLKDEFMKILEDAGVTSKYRRESLWEGRPTDDIDPERLREATEFFVKNFPQFCKEEYNALWPDKLDLENRDNGHGSKG